MDEKAVPTLVDTGTLFVEWPVCSRCHESIERDGANLQVWIHSETKSTPCRRSDR